MEHDRLFKELLRTFFVEFIARSGNCSGISGNLRRRRPCYLTVCNTKKRAGCRLRPVIPNLPSRTTYKMRLPRRILKEIVELLVP